MPILKETSILNPADPRTEDPALQYRMATKQDFRKMIPELRQVRAFFGNESLVRKSHHAYKDYPRAEWIPLRPSGRGLKDRLVDLLRLRRTEREFGTGRISFADFSSWLMFSAGEKRHHDPSVEEKGGARRFYPSGGALYPIEIYIIAWNIEGLAPGVYHYNVRRNGLERLSSDPGAVSDFYRDQSVTKKASSVSACLIFTGVFERSRVKYGARHLRFCYLECGHLAQNLSLQASSHSLAFWAQGELNEIHVDDLLGIDGVTEGTLHSAVVGPSPRSSRRNKWSWSRG